MEVSWEPVRAPWGAVRPSTRQSLNQVQTTFSSSLPITINNKKLPKGLYTLWTIPNTSSWEIIFNSKQYPWGVDDQMKPMRDSEFDVLTVEIPVTEFDQVIEQFTIGFDNLRNPLEMYLAWDNTRINIPIIPN